MFKQFPRSLAALTGLCCLSVAQAQENQDQQINLEPLSVVSTRIDDDTALTPANITVISSEDIRQSPAKTLPELLSLEAGILSRSLYGNSAVRSTVDIRGFGDSASQNTLVLLDGRRLNDIELDSPNYAAIPLNNIERIEIIHGAGGVLYGSGAVGGAINIVTRRPEAGTASGSASLSYGSYNTREADVSALYGADNFSVNAAANYAGSDGYRDNNEFRQKNIYMGGSHYLGSTELFINGGASDQDLRLPGVRTVDPTIGLNELESDRRGTGTPNDYAEEKNQFITTGIRQHILDGAGEIVLDVGYRHKNQKAFFDDYVGFPPFFPPGTFSNYLDTDVDTWSFTPRIQANSGNHDWVAGFDFYKYQYDSERSLNRSTSSSPNHILDITQYSRAFYANDRVGVTAATFVEIGARIQNVSISAEDTFDPTAPASPFVAQAANNLSRSDTEHMFNFGVRHFLTHDLSAFGRIARSVRFATVDELYQANPVTFVQEFSIINPQTAEHIDIGVDYNAGDISGSLTGYFMDLENEIFFNPVTFANENLDPTERIGIEASLDVELLDNLSAQLNYTYLRSKFSEGPFAGNDVPVVPRHSGSISLLWHVTSRTSLSGSWRYIGEKAFANDAADTFSREIPAYDILDLKLMHDWHDWSVSFSANNLLDEKAYAYGVNSTATPGRFNAYPLPERNFTATLSYHFN